jgi:vancomycin resistance protein YoaR
MIQSLLAVSAGVAVLFNLSYDDIPLGVSVGMSEVEGMKYSEAAARIESDYSDWYQANSLKLVIEDGDTYEIPFSQIDAAVDGEATVNSLKTIDGLGDIPRLLQIHFGKSSMELRPVVKFDEAKLRMALLELSDKIFVEATDAQMKYVDGKVEKEPEIEGRSLNVSNTADFIGNQLADNPLLETITLSRYSNSAIDTLPADITMRDFDDIQNVISGYTITTVDKELSGPVQFAADAINGTILPPASQGGEVFSFVNCLKSKSLNFENDNEGYDQVASTLYAALLSAGIPRDSITRLPHKLAVDYIEPGLDAWISGNAGDLKFSNPFDHKIAIFAEKKNNMITVAIAGKGVDMTQEYEISMQIVQRIAPPVAYVEDSSLKPGEKIVLNPGKEGIVVNVFRNDELISSDRYEAEKRIVRIAPESGVWDDERK